MCRVLSRKYLHRLIARPYARSSRVFPRCWELLATPPQTKVGGHNIVRRKSTMKTLCKPLYYYYEQEDNARGILRFCVANGPCKLRTGFRGIVRVVIFFFYCYSRTRGSPKSTTNSSPADDFKTKHAGII